MKKILTILLCFLCLCSYAQISKTKADELLKSHVLSKTNTAECWIERYNGSGNVKLLYDETIVVPANSYVYAVIYEPEQGWLDGYEYYFVNKSNGTITKHSNSICLATFDNWTRIYGADFKASNQLFNFSNAKSQLQKDRVMASAAPTTVQSHKYGVIISGGADESHNHIRYWNNCSALYQVLKRYYGYKDSDIYVLVSDGTSSSQDRNYVSDVQNPKLDSSPLDLDGDGVNDIEYKAIKSDITKVFDELSKKVTPEDNLFIFTTDHGSLIGGKQYLNLWKETMSIDEFSKEVDKVNAGFMSILMIQCYSGGFMDKLKKDNRVIITAASGNETAKSTLDYGCFFAPWIAAVSGQNVYGGTVNADANGDGEISMYEAFQYAKSNDYAYQKGQEHPQYSSLNSDLGTRLTLNGYIGSTHKCVPTVYANKTFSSNQTIKKCCVEFKNVVVKNNANVVVDIDNEFLAQDGFEVQLGADFTVK